MLQWREIQNYLENLKVWNFSQAKKYIITILRDKKTQNSKQ